MNTTNIRSMMAAAVIIFAITLSGCQKTEVEPANNGNGNGNTPTSPVTPVNPVTPATSFKIQSIFTADDNGTNIRTQNYTYNGDQLFMYTSKTNAGVDTVQFATNRMAFSIAHNQVQHQ